MRASYDILQRFLSALKCSALCLPTFAGVASDNADLVGAALTGLIVHAFFGLTLHAGAILRLSRAVACAVRPALAEAGAAGLGCDGGTCPSDLDVSF